MTLSIELMVLTRLLISEDDNEIETLLSYDPDRYFTAYLEQIKYIHKNKEQYGHIPSVFEFQEQFPDITILPDVKKPLSYLEDKLASHRRDMILLESFNKIKELGQDDGDIAIKYLSQKIEEINDCETDKSCMDIIGQAEERIKQVQEYAKQARIPTGFKEIDEVMYGGLSTVEELCVIVARTNSGKAQPLSSPVLTTHGWTTMGQLKVGDLLVGANNDNGKIVKIFPQGVKDYYKITFDDNTVVECCDDHLWLVLDGKRRERQNKNYGRPYILTTRDLRTHLDNKFSVDISTPIEFDTDFNEDSELDGYLLGLIIGDGSLRDNRVVIANENEELWERVESIISKYSCRRSETDPFSIVSIDSRNNFVRRKIIEYGLMNVKSINKFIPKQFLTAPIHVRKALLAGLLDTDGYITKGVATHWEFDTASEQLAADFAELARSLGVWVKVHDRLPSYYTDSNGVKHEASGSRHIVCRSNFNPFLLSTKACRYHYRTEPLGRSMIKRLCKMIRSIEYAGRTECQCILLDNVSHTYITNNYTVTHNTWVCAKMIDSAQANGFPVAYYSPEMQAAYLATRFDTWRGNFKNSDIFRGQYSPEYLEYIQKLKTSDCPAYIIEDKDFADGVSVRTLSNFVRKNKIKLLIIDGISYMQDDNKATRDQEKFKNIALGLFKLSKKYGCAVVLVMQANREVRSKDSDKGDAIPDLFNAEGSDQPGRIATQAFGIRQDFTEHKLDIKLLKSRNANNQNPVFSYLWSINDGIMTYMQEDGTAKNPTAVAPNTNPGSFRPITFGNRGPDSSDLSLINDSNTDSTDNEFSDIEF